MEIVRELYRMSRRSEPWELVEPGLDNHGRPILHDIAQILGFIQPGDISPDGKLEARRDGIGDVEGPPVTNSASPLTLNDFNGTMAQECEFDYFGVSSASAFNSGISGHIQ